jgi:hypothetical protein
MALVLLSTFAPWAMLRLIPFTEIAAGASGAIHGELPRLTRTAMAAGAHAGAATDWLPSLTAHMRTHAQQAGQTGGRTPSGAQPLAGVPELADLRRGAGSGEDSPADSGLRFEHPAGDAGDSVASAERTDAPLTAAEGAEPAENAAHLTTPTDAAGLTTPTDVAPHATPTDVAPHTNPTDVPTRATPTDVAPLASPAGATNPPHADPAPADPLRKTSGRQLADIDGGLPADYSAAPLWLGLEEDRPSLKRSAAGDASATGAEQPDPLPERQRNEDGLL